MSNALVGFVIIVSVAVLLFLLARLLLFKLLERKLFENDRIITQTPAELGLPYEELLIKTGSRQLQAWLVSAPDAAKPSPVILLLHGQGETVSKWLRVQAYLFGHGISSMVFDYSAYGNSTGTARIRHLREDALAAYGTLKQQVAPDTAKYALGFSMGAAIMLEAFGDADNSLAGLILAEPFLSIRELVVAWGIIPKPLAFIGPDVLNSLKTIGQVNRPLLVVHSQADEIVPLWQAKRLYQAANAPKELVVHDKFQHNAIWQTPEDDYWVPIVRLEFRAIQVIEP
jgi:alpha-beta hydrolase superfamily lysophospholipase